MSTAEQDLFDLLHRLSTSGVLRRLHPAPVGASYCGQWPAAIGALSMSELRT